MQNVQIHLKIIKSGESKHVLVNELIVHCRKNATTVKIKTCQSIYAYMARMSDNDECPSKDFGDTSQLTDWILDSVATCHMTPQVSDLIPG